MCLDCCGVTTANSAICVCFLIRYADSVVLVTLTAILLSIIVDIEWEISRLAVSVNFSNRVTVPVVFHFDGWSMKAVTVFVVAGGIVRSSSMMFGCGLVVDSLEAVLTCIVKWGKCRRPCVVSMTTLLFPIKCNPIIGPVNFFITTNCSAKPLSQISNFSVAVVIGFSNWPFCYLYLEIGRFVNFENINWGVQFYGFQVILGNCAYKCSWVHQGIYRVIILKIQRHVEHFLLLFQDYCRR